MRRILLTVELLSLIAWAGFVFSGASPEHVYTDEKLLTEFYPYVARITVVAVSDKTRDTNGDPPQLTIKVGRFYKGQYKTPVLSAIWQPIPHDIDWGGGDSTRLISEWGEKPLLPPATGTVWLVAGDICDEKIFHIAPRCRYPFDAEKEKWLTLVLSSATP